MLCAVCSSIFFNGALHGPWHPDLPSIAAAAKNGCKICHHVDSNPEKALVSDFEYSIQWGIGHDRHYDIAIRAEPLEEDGRRGQYGWDIYVNVSAAAQAPPGYDQFVDLVTADLAADPCRVRSEFPSLRYIPDNTGHEDVAKLAKQWLESCKADHQCELECGQQDKSWYPKRLIEVGTLDQPPRLVSRDDKQLQGPYAALSHCWGTNPDFLVLKSDVVDDFRKQIPMDKLPASFRDAIITCRRLDILHIWIDSLCIIQDSHSDWLFHSEEMSKVYLNCELNIAIDASENPHGGAFRPRDPTLLQDCCVWTPLFVPQDVNDWFTPSEDEFKSPDGINLCEVYTADDFALSRLDRPLSRRAWIFQERLLSPRTLYFSPDRISWECGFKRTVTEYLPHGHKNAKGRGFDVLFRPEYNVGENGSLFFFYELVDGYMTRELSFPAADKLVAFAAVAKRCASWFQGDYCAGIFRDTMPWGLLWEASGPAAERSQAWRAPSWSWASVDSRVRGDFIPDKPRTALAQIINVSVELAGPNNQFGQVKSASLALTGPIVSAAALLDQNGQTIEEDLPDRLDWDNSTSALGHHFRLIPDESDAYPGEASDEWISSQQGLFFLAIGEGQGSGPDRFNVTGGTAGLVVKRMEDGNYTRVGHWDGGSGFVDNHAQTICEFRTETITIL